jgi:hypothetical protein
MHHIHQYVADPAAVQAWYVKNFGAVAGKRNNLDTANVPGAELRIAYIVDPWGTYIELTEGLTPPPAQSASR